MPWTMNRDEKNLKPLDVSAFHILLPAAREIRMRHQHQLHASLSKKVVVRVNDADIVVALAIVPDEDAPYATLTARPGRDRGAAALAEVHVAASFKLTDASAIAWIENGFERPAS